MKKVLFSILKLIYSVISILFLKIYLCSNKKKSLFISHDMSISGAPLVLKNLVLKIWKEYNSCPIILTLVPGELCFSYLKEGIIPISCQFFKRYITKLIISNQYDVIFVNTVVCYKWAEIFEENGIKYYWWIHEGRDYLSKYAKKIPAITKYGKVLFVSPYSQRIFSEMGSRISGDIFPYYIQSNDYIYPYNNRSQNEKEEKIKCISIIGSICPRKNQGELIEAYSKLIEKHSSNIELRIIGKSIDEEYGKQIENLISKYEAIKWIDYVPNSEIWKVYKESDVLVCCSTDDPFPVTVTEAFMYGCTAVVSSNCGQYELINNTVSGYTYQQGDINELVNSIELALDSSEKVLSNELDIYNQYFTEPAFDSKLKEILQKG